MGGCSCDDGIYFAMNNSVRMLIGKLLIQGVDDKLGQFLDQDI